MTSTKPANVNFLGDEQLDLLRKQERNLLLKEESLLSSSESYDVSDGHIVGTSELQLSIFETIGPIVRYMSMAVS